jgi:pyridoxamine 5'-phosphate oxidase
MRQTMSEQNAPDGGIAPVDDPFALFAEWLKAAGKSEPNDPGAMALATVDEGGLPDVRMVLLKAVDERGFVFYTNLQSAKGQELAGHPKAALCFHWKSLRRQVRVRGPVTAVAPEEADAYFASRAKDSQIGAWASAQSRPMASRWVFEKAIAKFALKYGLTKVPRPPHWSGYRICPLQLEFWRDRPFRLHDRLVYRRAGEDLPWRTEKLYP